MDRNNDRPSRGRRNAYNSEEEQYQYNDQYSSPQADASANTGGRRRRSQAQRLRTDDVPASYQQPADEYDDYRAEPAPQQDFDSTRRYSRTAAQAPAPRAAAVGRKASRTIDDLYEDDGYDPLYDRRYVEQPDASYADPYDDQDDYEAKYDSRYDKKASKTSKKKQNKKQKASRYDDYDDFDDDREPLYDDYDGYGGGKPRKKKSPLRWIIAVIIIVALLAGVTLVVRNNPDLIESAVNWGRGLIGGADPTAEPEPEPTIDPGPTEAPVPDLSMARVIGFLAEPLEQPDISAPVNFRVTTTAQTTKVQIVNDNGEILYEGGEADYTDGEDGRVWRLMYYFPQAYDGVIEAYPGNEAGWNEASGTRLAIKVGDTSTLNATADNAGGDGITNRSLLAEGGIGATAGSVTGQAYTKDGPMETVAREKEINMGDASGYVGESGMKGVLTFRGSSMRQNAAYGTVSPTEMKLEKLWSAPIGSVSDGDYAWNVQPLVVQWHSNVREMMQMNDGYTTKGSLQEVIFASSDGNFYFFDLEDGAATRPATPVDGGMTMLSTPSVYPLGLPELLIGTGDPATSIDHEKTGLIVFNALKSKTIGRLLGKNSYALSSDCSFITSPLIDNSSDTVIGVGGNGLLYTMLLNSTLDNEKGLSINPDVSFFLAGEEGDVTAVDSSLAVYGSNAYYATNGGHLVCVNLNTMQAVWSLNVGADTDAAVMLDNSGGSTVLYHATKSDVEGMAHVRSINADTGDVNWDAAIAGGSISASPLLGTGALSGHVFVTAKNAEETGTLYALNTTNGSITWEYALTGHKPSSPVALYDDAGGAWIVQGEEGGVHLVDALTGERADFLELDGAVYGSPAAFNNTILIATEAGTLHAFRVK